MGHRRLARASSALAALTVIVGAVAGCATATPEPTSTAGASVSESTRPPFQTTTPGPLSPTGTPISSVPEQRWNAIVADLAARGVAGTPELVSAEEVTFNDGSLGCPQPGQSYTQALVDGMRVVVSADGTTFDYRFGHGATPKLCTR